MDNERKMTFLLDVLRGYEGYLRGLCFSLLTPWDKATLPPVHSEWMESLDQVQTYVHAVYNSYHRALGPVRRRVMEARDLRQSDLARRYTVELDRTLDLLANGDQRINDPALGFAPSHFRHLFNRYGHANWVFLDTLLYEWDIRHVRIPCGSSKDVLLYYLLAPDKVLALAVGRHRDLNDSRLLEIVAREFPDRLIPALEGILVGNSPSPSDLKAFRNAGMVSAVNVAGSARFPRHVFSTARTLSNVSRAVAVFMREVDAIRLQLEDREWVATNLYQGREIGHTPDFAFLPNPENFGSVVFFLDRASGVAVPFRVTSLPHSILLNGRVG